jgi:hypothetical protein
MSLRSIAHSDLESIIHDADTSVRTVSVTSPAGETVDFFGWANDIFLTINPGTGEFVSGRQITISLLIADLKSAGFGAIKGIPETASRPWVLEIEGFSGYYRVTQSNPDNGLGLTVLFLEEYKK